MATYRFKGKKVTPEELATALPKMTDVELVTFTEAIGDIAVSSPLPQPLLAGYPESTRPSQLSGLFYWDF